MRRNRVLMAVLVMVGLLLLFAWYDGGREEQRWIEQPVAIPEAGQ